MISSSATTRYYRYCCPFKSMLTTLKRSYAILWILLHISANHAAGPLLASNQTQVTAYQQSKQQLTHTNTSSLKGTDQAAVDDIIQDTIGLLDALDQKLAHVNNKTMTYGNLSTQSAAGSNANSKPQVVARALNEQELLNLEQEASFEEALIRMADGFSSGRRIDEHQSNNHGELDAASNNERATLASPEQTTATRRKAARQLLSNSEQQDNQLSSDSTDRHIKFTLDLMRSIFTSQSYLPKTNLIESFLISPLSIQMVLMMMHLGARGQTRREISNCLHLDKISSSSHASSSSSSPSTSLIPSHLPAVDVGILASESNGSNKLKRRHHQQVSSENNKQGLKPTSSSLRQQQQHQSTSSNPHELFGGAMRNLLKDPIVMKALTSANQIFLQKNLPLSAQYEWAIRHYYAADVKLVDFQHQFTPSVSSSSSGARAPLVAPSTPPHLLSSPLLSQNEKGKPHAADLGLNFSEQHLPIHVQKVSNSTTSNVNSTTEPHLRSTRDDHQAQANNNNNIQQMINDWVERQTHGRISNFLTSPVSSSTLMMAINVLYFKGDWQYKFDPSDTESDAWFTQANGKTVKIPMMVNKLPLAFAHDPYMKTSVIELPYKAQRLGLFLLLPDEISGIFHTMQMLNSTSFANLISSMRKPSPTADQSANGINVRIPKFSIDSSPRLSQILSQQLGIKSLFTPDLADLTGMFASQTSHQKSSHSITTTNSSLQYDTPQQQIPLQVGLDELLHKAVLQVDEQGSVAAASSATIVERVGLFNSNYFEADHPFLLFLMDKQTGLVLFSGVFAGTSDSTTTRPTNTNTNNNNNNAEVSQRH